MASVLMPVVLLGLIFTTPAMTVTWKRSIHQGRVVRQSAATVWKISYP
jgi:hypothetical protein